MTKTTRFICFVALPYSALLELVSLAFRDSRTAWAAVNIGGILVGFAVGIVAARRMR